MRVYLPNSSSVFDGNNVLLLHLFTFIVGVVIGM